MCRTLIFAALLAGCDPVKSTADGSSLAACEGEGTECAVAACVEWGSCDSETVCALSGTQTRTCTSYICRSGLCTPEDRTEQQACTRTTDGTTCAPDECPDFDPCVYEGDPECDPTGSQTRQCTRHTCAAGTCQPSGYSDFQACARTTQGATCGTATCGNYNGCVYDGDPLCDTTGSRTRTCTPSVCSNETCSGVGTPFTQTDTAGCARNTAGVLCGTATCEPITACRYEDGNAPQACDETSERTCTRKTCSAATCTGPVSTYPDVCLTRDTDGRACSINGNAGACGEGQCDIL